MTEQDLFEQRLRTALRRHTADAPVMFDALDFAHAAATRAPRRHGLARVVAWRLAPAPMPAWVLVTVLLLTALVAGLLVVGSRPQQELPAVVPPVFPAFACPPGSTPDRPGPVDQARPVIGDGLAGMVFDRRAGRIVLLAQLLSGAQTWTFDVCANTWTRMHPDLEPGNLLSGATYLIYDVDSDATIANDGVSTWVYDLQVDTWTRMGAAPVVRQWNTLTWTYDPVSGLVIAADAGELWSYDVETDTWASKSPVPWQAGHGSIAYDASVDRIVAYALGAMWLFDIRTGTWSKSGADTPMVVCGMGWPNPTTVYDEVSEQTVVSCDVTVAYDATADRWESLADKAGPFAVFDSANRRFLGLEDEVVVAFDPATRERMVLLEPSDGQPTSSSE